MKRHEITEKLDQLYEEADRMHIGLNETELEYKEKVTDWILELVNKNALLHGVSNNEVAVCSCVQYHYGESNDDGDYICGTCGGVIKEQTDC